MTEFLNMTSSQKARYLLEALGLEQYFTAKIGHGFHLTGKKGTDLALCKIHVPEYQMEWLKATSVDIYNEDFGKLVQQLDLPFKGTNKLDLSLVLTVPSPYPYSHIESDSRISIDGDKGRKRWIEYFAADYKERILPILKRLKDIKEIYHCTETKGGTYQLFKARLAGNFFSDFKMRTFLKLAVGATDSLDYFDFYIKYARLIGTRCIDITEYGITPGDQFDHSEFRNKIVGYLDKSDGISANLMPTIVEDYRFGYEKDPLQIIEECMDSINKQIITVKYRMSTESNKQTQEWLDNAEIVLKKNESKLQIIQKFKYMAETVWLPQMREDFAQIKQKHNPN